MSRYTISIMFPAMHDALNAIQPRYARWNPAAPDEPRGAGASPEAAVAAVAETVLAGLAEGSVAERAALLATALARVPAGDARERGLALGRSIALAALRRREADGFAPFVQFSSATRPGRWRPTPPLFGQDVVPTSTPLLFSPMAAAALTPPPPPLGSPVYLRDVEEVRRVGGRANAERSAAEAASAAFWAQQVSHRGFVDAVVALLDARPAPDGLWGTARGLALLSIGMDDVGVIIWQAKERYSVWRPVTALQEGGFGVAPDPEWMPLVTTPAFPEYPSGHAADCAFGGALLTALFGDGVPFTYRSLGTRAILSQRFASFRAAAADCSASRIWGGVHFRHTEEVSEAIGAAIAREALRHLQPVGGRGR
ncbi:phosphatase PAP2 family protein [Plastoroseomonas arctica]|uniref:Phosphatase PAP2 family protein n=1 Tax=Plastoroseomonas arctica TaxID=1509237 RepID=A0AAF1KJ10_9PROT|nr:phosphatase PAP2 family protein [Plastoroseomonas arctica]MBR0654929.1 phosphatase PAP2 family protein [Plastoroseomonas arctica]